MLLANSSHKKCLRALSTVNSSAANSNVKEVTPPTTTEASHTQEDAAKARNTKLLLEAFKKQFKTKTQSTEEVLSKLNIITYVFITIVTV